MQRKRRNINFGYFSGSSGKGQAKSHLSRKSKFNNSITIRGILHSIPTVRMSERSDKKSDVAKRNPFCGKIVNSVNVAWWASRNRALRAVISTRPSQTFMAPFDRIKRSPKTVIVRSSQKMTPYGEMQRYSQHDQSSASQVAMTSLSRLVRYLRPLPYVSIISLLVLSFLALTPNLYSSDFAYAVEDTNAGVSGRATSAGLSVSSTKLTETVSPGSTVYVNNTVSVNAKDIESYSLTISGPTTMKNGSTTISGSGGNTPSSMGDNTWGYAWDSSTNGSGFTDSSATYNSLPGTNTSTKLTTPALSNYGVEFSRKLGFAAKFAEDADPGHYIADITLSLVATPRTLGVWSTGQAAGISTMQQMNTAICNQVPTPAAGATDVPTMTLLDSRDGNYYNIAKYADGRCWMQENLRIAGRTIKAAESDFSGSDITLPSSSKSDFANNDTSKYSYQSYLSTASEASAGVSGYYNWYTATAGAGNSSVTTDNQNVNTSICPKGWTLPTGGSDREFQKFANAESIVSSSAGSIKIQGAPYNFKYTGYISGDFLNLGTSDGYWWSNTTYNVGSAYYLRISSSNVSPGTYSFNNRHFGYAVRCVAKEPDLSGITTMQEMTPGVCEKTPLISGQKYSAEYTLQDTRDGKSYTVRKLGDGKCWMTSNLKLKLTTAGLKQSDTDLNQGADWNQSSPSAVVKPTNTLTSLTTTSGNRDFSANKGYYAVQSYIASSSNAGETGYYSWNAATAGTGGTSSSDAIAANSQAPSSICPKGWTLPTGGGQSDVNTESTWSDYYKLFRNMGLTISNTNLKPGAGQYTNWGSGDLDIVQNKLDSNSKVVYNFKYTGRVYDSSLNDTGDGYWWSSTANSATNAYFLYIGSSYVGPGTASIGRYLGNAVRCIARS